GLRWLAEAGLCCAVVEKIISAPRPPLDSRGDRNGGLVATAILAAKLTPVVAHRNDIDTVEGIEQYLGFALWQCGGHGVAPLRHVPQRHLIAIAGSKRTIDCYRRNDFRIGHE